MKTQNNFLKNLGKVAVILSVLFITSCGSDDDGTEVGFVEVPAALLTTYTGNLLYNSNSGMVIENTGGGRATLSRSGDSYTISFNDDVPSVTGIIFIAGSNGTFTSASVGSSASAGISVEAGALGVGITINGSTWSFGTN